MPFLRRGPISRELVTYEEPYTGFPILNLTLHPYVAIVHAYRAFRALDPVILTDEQLQIYSNLRSIWTLWETLEKSVQTPSSPKALKSPTPPRALSPSSTTTTQSSAGGGLTRAERRLTRYNPYESSSCDSSPSARPSSRRIIRERRSGRTLRRYYHCASPDYRESTEELFPYEPTWSGRLRSSSDLTTITSQEE